MGVKKVAGRRWVGAALACSAVALTAVLSFANIKTAGAAGAGLAVSDQDSPVMRRLTPNQYKRLIRDVFGPGIEIGGRFEPSQRVAGLVEVGTGKVSLASAGFEQYDAIGRSIASQVLSPQRRDLVLPCKPARESAPDNACARQFLQVVGEQLYRRPLTDMELSTQVELANEAATKLKSFYTGLELSMASMFVQLQFLFRQETVAPVKDVQGRFELDAYSKASRLSFFLWDAAPDRRLLAAAASGKLNTSAGVKEEVERLLASPRLEDGVRSFFSDMFGFDSFDSLAKDPTLYPNFTRTVADDGREQTMRTVVDLLLAKNGDYRDLFTTRRTFLTPILGSMYRVPVTTNLPNGFPETVWTPYEYPANDPRGGILTQVSFVSLHSHPGRTSPTLRGKALREMILCQRVPDPPGNVNFTVVQDTSNPVYKTSRERLTAHATEAMCTGCHRITDPMGLALENFDSDGVFRTTENGAAINTSGVLDGVEFTNAPGLGKAVRDNPATTRCLVNRLTSYALGRGPAKAEDTWMESLQAAFAAKGYRVPDLMRSIVTSPEFYQVSVSQSQ